MDSLYQEYATCVGCVNSSSYDSIYWPRVKETMGKLRDAGDYYAQMYVHLLVSASISFTNYMIQQKSLQGCPCDCARFFMGTFELPSYIDHISINSAIYKEILRGNYCYCGHHTCKFKSPYPFSLTLPISHAVVNYQFGVVGNTYHKTNDVIGFTVNTNNTIVG